MCGRFILQGPWAEMHDMYNLIRPEDKARNVEPRYNIAPTQDVLFVMMKMVREHSHKAVGGWCHSGPRSCLNGRCLMPEVKTPIRNQHSEKHSKANGV